MLLEKLNGTVPCLLDTTTIPPEELSMKPSRSGADSGICEGPGAGSVRHSNGEPSSSSGHPYNRTFSSHFHAFVELCLQRDPEKRLTSLSSYMLTYCIGYVQDTNSFPSVYIFRPSATTLVGHPFFKQVCVASLWRYNTEAFVFVHLLYGDIEKVKIVHQMLFFFPFSDQTPALRGAA